MGAPVNRQSVAENARLIAAITALARIAGFARTLVFAACVGATTVGTAYQSANAIPNVVFEIAAGGVLAAIVVPLLAARVEQGRSSETGQIASALVTWTITVLLPLAIVLAVSASLIARALLDSPQQVDLATRMLWVFAPQVVLYGIGIVGSGVLAAHHRFLAAAAAPLVSSLVLIATYLAYAATARAAGEHGAALTVLAGGTTLGVVAMVLTLLPSARATGVRLRPTLAFPPGVAARARRLAGAGLIALVGQQLSVVAVLWLTNRRAAEGSINGYQYVQAIYLLPYAVLAVPLAAAAYPVLAGSDGSGTTAASTLARTARSIVLLTGLAASALALAADDLGVFFGAIDAGRAGPGAEALGALPATVRAFAPGLIGFGLCALLTRALYVRGRARLGSVIMGGGWLLAAVIPLALVGERTETARTLRLLGLGSSIGMTVAGLALLVLVRSGWGRPAVAGVGRTLAAASSAALLAAAFGRGLRGRLPAADGPLEAVGAGLAAGAAAAVMYLCWLALTDGEAVRAALRRGRFRSGAAPSDRIERAGDGQHPSPTAGRERS